MNKKYFINDNDLKIENFYSKNNPSIWKVTYLPTGFSITYSADEIRVKEIKKTAIEEIINYLKDKEKEEGK